MDLHNKLVIYLCFSTSAILLASSKVHKFQTRTKLWYATAGEFLVLPCFKNEVSDSKVSLIRWYESYGNPIWANFYLTIQVYEKEDRRNFFCDVYSWRGEKSHRIWHKIIVYVQPIIFFDFLCSIPTENFFSIEQQKMTDEGAKFLKKLKADVKDICRRSSYCRFATVLLDQSLREQIMLSSNKTDAAMLNLAEKHDNKTTQVSICYQIDTNNEHFMTQKPDEIQDSLKSLMESDFQRAMFRILLIDSGISVATGIETICPVGHIRQGKSIRCFRCPSGSASPMGSASCTPCPRGFYQPEAGRGECMPCPPMYVTTATGAKKLSQCLVDGNHFISAFAVCMQYFWKILAHADFENYNYVVIGTFVYFFGSTLIVMRLLYRIYIFQAVKSHYAKVERRLMKVATLGQITIAERQNIQLEYQKMLDRQRDAMQASYF